MSKLHMQCCCSVFHFDWTCKGDQRVEIAQAILPNVDLMAGLGRTVHTTGPVHMQETLQVETAHANLAKKHLPTCTCRGRPQFSNRTRCPMLGKFKPSFWSVQGHYALSFSHLPSSNKMQSLWLDELTVAVPTLSHWI